MPQRKERKVRKKARKEPKAFRYGRQGGRSDPYFATLNNIQQQAHAGQVNSLIRELKSSQDFARRARQEAIEEIYAPVTAMEVDDHRYADNRGRRIQGPPAAGPSTFVRSEGAKRKEQLRRERMVVPDGNNHLHTQFRSRMAYEEPPPSPRGRYGSGLGRVVDTPVAMEAQPSPADAQAARIVASVQPAVADGLLRQMGTTRARVIQNYPPIPTRQQQQQRIAHFARANARMRSPNISMSSMLDTLDVPDSRYRGIIRPAERAPSLVPLPQRPRNRASDTYESLAGSEFQRAPRQDTQLEYNPATRDNKSRRVPQGSQSGPVMAENSRFANLPSGPRIPENFSLGTT